jgi:uncharacterized membrane protein
MNPSFMRCFFARYLPNAMHVDEKNKQRFFGRLMSPSFLVLAIWGSLATGVCGATASDERLPSFEGRIVSLHEVSCGSDLPCQDLTVRITTGELQGKDLAVRMTPGNFVSGFRAIHLKVGDMVLLEGERGDGDVHAVVVDVVRRPALFTLTALFLFCVVIFGGIGAIRSVFGMAVSFVVVFSFILPRIIAGDSPLVISIIGATAIMLGTLIISHGWNAKTWAALGGTIGSLIVTGFLALFATNLASLSGLSDEESFTLLLNFPSIDARGLLLSGIIIGALGALDDLTISQASAVFELKMANAKLSARELYAAALRIGRDHIAAAVNTLVLAYAGSSLALLLLLSSSPTNDSWMQIISHENVATEIVRTIVGSIGLLTAVPLTTWLAAFLAMRLPQRMLHGGHAHPHH